MDSHDIKQIDKEDFFAEINLEIDEIDSIIKMLCLAMENFVQADTEMTHVRTVLFMLQGNLSTLKNNLRLAQAF